ncbi:MAG: ROK family protein [Bacilli bacterium]|jgi:predicted NBD/HSP70 family sugar kinase|nr:ROK family protein [Bacilli bacterium]
MKYVPSLDKGFQPAALMIQNFLKRVQESGSLNEIVLCLERAKGYNYVYKMNVFPDQTGHDEENFEIVERIVKSLLWMVGGYKLYVANSPLLAKKLQEAYSSNGIRAFDFHFMSKVFEAPFEVIACKDATKLVEVRQAIHMENNLNGCRIGFDAGGSDRKVSAVIDGKVVFSDEVVWFPKIKNDPQYHYDGIMDSIKTAASYMPRVDSIGVSTAGICVDNKIMVASLFIKVPDELYDNKVKNIYKDIAKEFGDIPLVVANDGDVTALAGAMELKTDKILGIAMGTSEAGGYIGDNMALYGWLNELAFVPVDFNQNAMIDEWSGDYGCGVKYFSQDSVIKLAEYGGFQFDPNDSPARRLAIIQDLYAKDDPLAHEIFENIGIYLGYTIAYYSMFYDIKHILLLGRVVSGRGGNTILAKAREVLYNEFNELANIIMHLPDEKNRRVGQSIAAASLPIVHFES